MDRYKKKNLRFMGKGPEVRAAERDAARGSVRQQRFSLQRPLEETDVSQVKSQESKVPTLGIKQTQSRLDMLFKWKAEKELKKRLELKAKKPVFKVGMVSASLSTLQTLQASRTQPVSKLAGSIQHKSSLKAEAKASVKATVPNVKATVPNVKATVPSAKATAPSAKATVPRIIPPPKTQIAKPPATKDMTAIMKPGGMQTRQNLAKNALVSNSKSQNNAGMKPNKITQTNFKPQTISAVKESKIPMSGKKPTTLLPLRKPLLQNQQNKSKPSSGMQTKVKVAKAVEIPLNQDLENETGLSSEQSLQSCPLSAIEPVKETSFAPPGFTFTAPKIRSSWLEDEGPCAILSRVVTEMNGKQRTSTPIKKELLETSFDAGESVKTGESSSDAKKYSTIPNSDTQYIESLINGSITAKHSELDDKKAALPFSIDDVEDSKSASSDNKENQGLESDIACVNKEMGGLALSEKGNLLSDVKLPVKENVIEPASSHVGNQELETSPDKKGILCVASEKNSDLCDESKDVKVASEELSTIKPCLESIDQSKDSTDNVLKETDVSVFYPSEPVAAAPLKGKRFFPSCWKMGKPSLALISESLEQLTPRRSMRLAMKKDLFKEENIFDVQECFLDSPSVEAATRMTMRPYDFDGLNLEACSSQGKSDSSKSISRGKVSLLYTPPRTRASTRLKSLKGDLMSFSPNVE